MSVVQKVDESEGDLIQWMKGATLTVLHVYIFLEFDPLLGKRWPCEWYVLLSHQLGSQLGPEIRLDSK